MIFKHIGCCCKMHQGLACLSSQSHFYGHSGKYSCFCADAESLGQMLADLSSLYNGQGLPQKQETRLGMQQIISKTAGLLSSDAEASGLFLHLKLLWHHVLYLLKCIKVQLC